VVSLASIWEETTITIPAGKWRNELGGEVYDGGQLALAKLTARFPVSLLVRQEAAQ
jgi:(1->4)-alpha-D-glucan 1-alpha-D-glucosylmutase